MQEIYDDCEPPHAAMSSKSTFCTASLDVMNPRRVHELMNKYFPPVDAVSLDWQNVMDRDGLKSEVLTALLKANIPAEDMLIEVHRKVGNFLPLEKAVSFIGEHIGQGQIKVADRDFKGCIVIAVNGVAAAVPVASNIRMAPDGLVPNGPYLLEKSIWTESDFEIMGWHDSRIWATAANEEKFEFALDLDYIFNWVHPGPGETYFKFWVAPVTMVFENAYDIKIEIASRQGIIEVADLHREEPKLTPNGEFTEHLYRFDCQEGEISLRATGYRLYVRSEPRLMQGQCFTLEKRGGISVEQLSIAV